MEVRPEEFLEICPGRRYYETFRIKATRKVKRCDICSDNMPKGSTHVVFKFYGEDGDWPVIDVCYHCEIDNRNNIKAMQARSYG